ncbi:MAG: Uma2 family endonuclease [Pirellulales bacterium]
MSTVAQKFVLDQHYVFWNMDRKGYRTILEAVGGKRLRHTYDDGVLEIMSPSRNHERYKRFLARMVETMTFELRIPIQSLGSLTMSPTEDRGLEPDECYFLTKELDCSRNAAWDPLTDPAPDLAIEIEVTNSIRPRLPIFAKLKIREIWTYDGEELKFLCLGSNHEYQPAPQSLAFPFLTPHDLMRFLGMIGELDENSILHLFIDWLNGIDNV